MLIYIYDIIKKYMNKKCYLFNTILFFSNGALLNNSTEQPLQSQNISRYKLIKDLFSSIPVENKEVRNLMEIISLTNVVKW